MMTTKVNESPHHLQSLLVGDIIRRRILARIAMTVTVAMSPLLFGRSALRFRYDMRQEGGYDSRGSCEGHRGGPEASHVAGELLI